MARCPSKLERALLAATFNARPFGPAPFDVSNGARIALPLNLGSPQCAKKKRATAPFHCPRTSETVRIDTTSLNVSGDKWVATTWHGVHAFP
ncbi:MAG: hypothetical protein ACI87O_002629 [Planctomycetota bacterium]|jgi:hypothetical protein